MFGLETEVNPVKRLYNSREDLKDCLKKSPTIKFTLFIIILNLYLIVKATERKRNRKSTSFHWVTPQRAAVVRAVLI